MSRLRPIARPFHAGLTLSRRSADGCIQTGTSFVSSPRFQPRGVRIKRAPSGCTALRICASRCASCACAFAACACRHVSACAGTCEGVCVRVCVFALARACGRGSSDRSARPWGRPLVGSRPPHRRHAAGRSAHSLPPPPAERGLSEQEAVSRWRTAAQGQGKTAMISTVAQ